MLGIVRDYSPRIRLTLPGVAGIFQVEGVVDTGFEGELALPSSLARRLDADSFGKRRIEKYAGALRYHPEP